LACSSVCRLSFGSAIRDYAEADVASAAACLAGYVKLTMGRPYSFWRLGGFEIDDKLVFGRLPDRALGVTMLPLSRPSKAVDMPVIGGRAVHSAQRGRAKGVRPSDGVDEP
jgi:hypothetical protein